MFSPLGSSLINERSLTAVLKCSSAHTYYFLRLTQKKAMPFVEQQLKIAEQTTYPFVITGYNEFICNYPIYFTDFSCCGRISFSERKIVEHSADLYLVAGLILLLGTQSIAFPFTFFYFMVAVLTVYRIKSKKGQMENVLHRCIFV